MLLVTCGTVLVHWPSIHSHCYRLAQSAHCRRRPELNGLYLFQPIVFASNETLPIMGLYGGSQAWFSWEDGRCLWRQWNLPGLSQIWIWFIIVGAAAVHWLSAICRPMQAASLFTGRTQYLWTGDPGNLIDLEVRVAKCSPETSEAKLGNLKQHSFKDQSTVYTNSEQNSSTVYTNEHTKTAHYPPPSSRGEYTYSCKQVTPMNKASLKYCQHIFNAFSIICRHPITNVDDLCIGAGDAWVFHP